MSIEQKDLQNSANEIHAKLKYYYELWCDLQEVANSKGLMLDDKTATITKL